MVALGWVALKVFVILDSKNQLQVFDCHLKKVVEAMPAGNLELVFHNKFSASQFCYHGSFYSIPKGLVLLVIIIYKNPIIRFLKIKFLFFSNVGNEKYLFCISSYLGRKTPIFNFRKSLERCSFIGSRFFTSFLKKTIKLFTIFFSFSKK